MLFNSLEFIFLFLPITLIVYFLLNNSNKNKMAKIWLIIMSLYFYSYFNYSYLILIITSILGNYFLGSYFHLNRINKLEEKCILLMGIFFNLGVLGYFKYYNFFIQNINSFFKMNITLLKLVLPLGISFFTFQQLSFIIENYKKKSLNYDFLNYCLFVTFFPQLIAGPIVLPEEMLPQFEDEKNQKINYGNINRGIYVLTIGFFKKIILADGLSSFVNSGFENIDILNYIEAWFVSIAYTLQLYFDFSGYCDMAIGIALMFNIVLPLNFNSPYKATNIQEFWKRWHITLGRFLTNYLYIPLGGNRKGKRKTLRNLLIVFLISGVWHGAGWTFIIWGLLHGVGIVIQRIFRNFKKINTKMSWLITIIYINITWVFFRAENLQQACKFIYKMFNIFHSNINIENKIKIKENFKWFFTNGLLREGIGIFLLGIVVIFLKNTSELKIEFKTNKYFLLKILILFILALFNLEKVSEFLYFNF